MRINYFPLATLLLCTWATSPARAQASLTALGDLPGGEFSSGRAALTTKPSAGRKAAACKGWASCPAIFSTASPPDGTATAVNLRRNLR